MCLFLSFEMMMDRDITMQMLFLYALTSVSHFFGTVSKVL